MLPLCFCYIARVLRFCVVIPIAVIFTEVDSAFLPPLHSNTTRQCSSPRMAFPFTCISMPLDTVTSQLSHITYIWLLSRLLSLCCRSAGQRWVHAILWELATIVTFGLILGICYGVAYIWCSVLFMQNQCS